MGYNTMFAEGLYRLTQVVHDSKAPGVPVLFTWASRGKLTGYVYDNNSATAARDGLEHVLRLALASNADRVECPRPFDGQLGHRRGVPTDQDIGRAAEREQIWTCHLAAPDIDLDVFKSHMRRIGKPRKPFYVVLSKDDKALWVSRIVGGGETRVGDDPDVTELAALGATVIDLTDVKATTQPTTASSPNSRPSGPSCAAFSLGEFRETTKRATWATKP